MKNNKKQTAQKVYQVLSKKYPNVKTALTNWKNEFQFLVAIILSAQTTDKQVNKITIDLFKKYKSVEDFANSEIEDFAQDINSVGFYNMKAKNIVNAARKIHSEFNGEIPRDINQLISIPGVGKKTANVFLNTVIDNPQGIAVDTHVKRISNLLGLTENKDPLKIEEDLKSLFNKNQWGNITLLLIEHGRETCKAKRPMCGECVLKDVCPSVK